MDPAAPPPEAPPPLELPLGFLLRMLAAAAALPLCGAPLPTILPSLLYYMFQHRDLMIRSTLSSAITTDLGIPE
ncbi:hypothetical protein F2Q69_00002275 [Brassica cretica]|uniref:Uncharacterized protein n=1 Tax=Brassica cretica TaxID=69181 RepID=A0A8S9PDU5_BRACR|nr:hypothetical protein F2Q69_00002275 [Brassica cretica]